MIDFDSCINPPCLADPAQAALHLVLEAFPLGLLGYEVARSRAERIGNLDAFTAKFDALVAAQEVRVRAVAKLFPGGFATYLRARHAAEQRGERALAAFDADVETRTGAHLLIPDAA